MTRKSKRRKSNSKSPSPVAPELPWYRGTFGYAILGALLYWLALPPLDLWPLAWIAPIPWVLLIRVENLPGRRPYRALWLVGGLLALAAFHWLRLPDKLVYFGWLALGVYLSIYLPLFVGLSRVAVHRLRVPVILAVPVVWMGLELLRGHMLGGFTMGSIEHTQYRWLALIQIADLAGGYAVGFVIVLVVTCAGRMIPLDGGRRAWWPIAPAVCVLAATLAYGHFRMPTAETDEAARIALIQGSIDVILRPEPGTDKRMHEQYRDLSRQAVAEHGPLDLIVWPETVFGSPLIEYAPGLPMPDNWPGTAEDFEEAKRHKLAENHGHIGNLARELATPMLLGIGTRKAYSIEREERLNSALGISRGGTLTGRYDKVHLVLFGEYVPILGRYPEWNPIGSVCDSTTPGKDPVAFSAGPLTMTPNICFESVLPHAIRRQVNVLAAQGHEPDVLVNLTNDGWFRGSSELDMHFVCSVFRAVECRKPVLIAANTGLSGQIDASGRIVQRAERLTTDVLLVEVRPDARTSLYLKIGDLPAGICLACCCLLAVVGWVGRPKKGRQEA